MTTFATLFGLPSDATTFSQLYGVFLPLPSEVAAGITFGMGNDLLVGELIALVGSVAIPQISSPYLDGYVGMRELLLGQVADVEFSINGVPDALPVATVYAGTTMLGAAEVTELPGVNQYLAAFTLPETGIAPYIKIIYRVSASVDGEPLSTVSLVAGEIVTHRRATSADVSQTVDFNPTIEVAPTQLSSESVAAIREGLATGEGLENAAQSVIEHGDGDGGWGEVPEIDSDAIIAGVIAGLPSVQITRIGAKYDPVTRKITLRAGDDYSIAGLNAVSFSVTLPGFNLATVQIVYWSQDNFQRTIPGNATLINIDGDTATLVLEWARADTNKKPSDKYVWGVAFVIAGEVQTIIGGALVLDPPLVPKSVIDAAIT